MGFEIVVVGSAAGALKDLQTVLWGIPLEFRLPIVIAHHRRRDSELGLYEFLRQHCRLPLSEPEDKEEILPHHAYLAPRDYHLLIERRNFALSTDEPPAIRPSIDVLFESAADAYGRAAIAVLLTRGNRDGVRGLQSIKQRGGLTLLESHDARGEQMFPPAASEARSRAGAKQPARLAEADQLLPLSRIAPFLNNLTTAASVHYGI